MTAEGSELGNVKSVERALDVLEALSERGGQVGVSELSDATGLPAATIHRLLGTLVGRGYVRQDVNTRRYMLGAALVRLGNSAGRFVGTWVTPHLFELVTASGESANFALLEGEEVVYVAQVPSPQKMRLFAEPGNRVTAHSTAVGKVLLAFRQRSVAEQILARQGLPRKTPNTVTEVGRFMAELDTVVEHGYALDDEEEEVGVRCVAVPVFGVGDSVGAMSVSGPASRFDKAAQARCIPTMLRVAAEISQQLMGDGASSTSGSRRPRATASPTPSAGGTRA